MKHSAKHTQFTNTRRKVQPKTLLTWISVLTAALGLVKLVVEIIRLLH